MRTICKTLIGMVGVMLCGAGFAAMEVDAAEGLVYHADGTASYYEDGTALTGRIVASKDYVVGDIDGNSAVTSIDAACILTAAASSGVKDMTTEEVLAETTAFLPDAQKALQYADVNQDGSINVIDAASILSHSAIAGTTAEVPPLGSTIYHADADGILKTGWGTADSGEMYFTNEDFSLHTGWMTLDEGRYYFDYTGTLMTGWQTIGGKHYHFADSGKMDTGLVNLADGTYYFDADGLVSTEFVTIGDFMYYFGTDGKMCTETIEIDGTSYHFNAEGKLYNSFLVLDGKTHYYNQAGYRLWGGFAEIGDDLYFFDDDGVMLTGFVEYGRMYYFEPDGKLLEECYDITYEKTEILENADLQPHNSYTIWNRQVSPEKEYTKITLKEKDIAILEAFADKYFTEDMTMAQKLWITQQWINKKVDYAYVGEKWDSIVNLSYVEAIFVNRMGQCVQYNGAMAAMMIWFGYDVYMVKGYTYGGNQHFWTEVVIDDTTYLMECGNFGKNGYWHDFLEPIERS